MKRRSWLGLWLLLAASFLLSCLCGRYPLSVADLWRILTGRAAAEPHRRPENQIPFPI